MLFTPAVGWSTFSFEAENEEVTPNYQGLTLDVTYGYSFDQKIDLAAYVSYISANTGVFKVNGETAALSHYGAKFGIRVQKAVYIGIYGGGSMYQLYTAKEEVEHKGTWEGVNGGLEIGAILPKRKTKAYQVSFKIDESILSKLNREDGEEKVLKRLDTFTLTLAYVMNGKKSSIDDSFLGHYLKSLSFWD